MPAKNEGEVKRTEPESESQSKRNKPKKDADLEGSKDRSEDREKQDDSPLKTVGGTPIIERPEG
jgi:hypothetical protein